MPAKNDRIQLAPTVELRSAIDDMQHLTATAGIGTTVSMMLTLHTELMRAEARRVAFTGSEVWALTAIVGGPRVTAGVGALLIGQVLDAFDLGVGESAAGTVTYGDYYRIDEDALVGKLRGIGPSADLAIRIALARWWTLPDEDRDDFTVVGLRIVDDDPYAGLPVAHFGDGLDGPQRGVLVVGPSRDPGQGATLADYTTDIEITGPDSADTALTAGGWRRIGGYHDVAGGLFHTGGPGGVFYCHVTRVGS